MNYKNKILLLILNLTTFNISFSQSTISEIYTDYNGWWIGNSSQTILPDNSHNLLGFKVNGNAFSTGVNDALLSSHGVTFSPQIYKALPATSSISAGFIGVGSHFGGGVGDVTPNPITQTANFYLDDGANGLDLGTAIFNANGSISYSFDEIVPSSIGDGVPDIIITQMGSPSGANDQFSLLDASNNVIGNTLNIIFLSVSNCGIGDWKFYTPNTPPPATFVSNPSGTREIRIICYDFSDFGINASNYTQVKTFLHHLSGTSDQAFIAYNAHSVTNLPITLKSFSGIAKNATAHLFWETASETNNAFFTVEKSLNGIDWRKVDTVSGEGNSSTNKKYELIDQHPFDGISYYRLSQTDFDGKTTKFPQAISILISNPAPFKVYPNPSIDGMIHISGIKELNSFNIFSEDGKIVIDKIHALQSNASSITIDVSALKTGIYFIRSGENIQKFIIR